MEEFTHFDRYWLLTWTTYGSWLPGDSRGSVTSVHNRPGPRYRNNISGTPTDSQMAGLTSSAQRLRKGPPVRLNQAQAQAVIGQFRETASYRGWRLVAAAAMANHCHLVVGVPGDPSPDSLLRDFKAYGSRRLNQRWPRPKSDTWWTEGGSKRILKSDEAILGGARYVRDQEFALAIWIDPILANELGNPAPSQRAVAS